MSQIIEVVFDGHVLRPETPLNLPPNTRLRVVIDSMPAEVPKLGEPYSALRVLKEASLRGPADWSENVNKYVVEGVPERDE